MKNVKSIFLTSIIAMTLIGCASTVDKEAIEAELAAATLMTDQEMLDLIPGSTISGVSSSDGKTKWIQTYSTAADGETSGTIEGDFGGSAYDATWSIKDGQLCEDWGSGSGCSRLELVEGGTAIQRYGKKGKMKHLMYIE